MKVIFLHIPKTAGQSVHAALVNAFGEDAICPARVNDQLHQMSITDLNRYQVFSGHLDWSLLDCVKGPKYIFTVLREPMDRILSFYFYLREKAANMQREQLERPEHQGLKAALNLTPQEYFLGGAPHLRRFLDDHYDNFYTYYFAGRFYQGRGQLVGLQNRGVLDEAGICRMAQENLSTLDGIFSIDDMGQVFSTIADISGKKSVVSERYKTNVNKSIAGHDRKAQLRVLGADAAVFKRLNDYCRMDQQLWERYMSAPT